MHRVGPRLLSLSVLLVACGGLPDPTYLVERPPESRVWTPVPTLPDWVAAKPVTGETFRFVLEARSNLREIAARKGGVPAQVEHELLTRLAPALGSEDAARAAAAGAAAATLIDRAAKDEVLTRQMVPGNTLSTVWTLCEVPVSAILAPLSPAAHASARDALSR